MQTERLKFTIGALGLSKMISWTRRLMHACAVSAAAHALGIGFAEAQTVCSDGPLFSVQSFSGFSSYRSGGDGSSCPDPWYDVQTHAEQLTCNPMQGLFQGGWSIQTPSGIITIYRRSGNYSCRPDWWTPNGSIRFDATIQFKQNTVLSITTPFTRTLYSESDCNSGPATTLTFALTTAAGSALTGTPILKVCPQGSVTIDLGRRYSLPPGTYRLHAQADSPRSQIWSVYPDSLLVAAEVRTITVPVDALTVSAAIDLAESGDVIAVMEGTYHESIDLRGKSITIKAVGSRANTILDGTGLTTSVIRAVSGETSTTVLDGFTIRNGSVGSARGDLRLGGGMYIDSSSPTVRNCTFVSNSAGYGGGLYGFYSGALIEDCSFLQNTAAEDGGGLQFFGGTPVVRNCIITDNSCGNRGGGAHLVQHQSGGFPTLETCTITGNRASRSDGGGVSLASYAGASTKPRVRDCAITGNSASGHGGGLYATPMPRQLPNVVLTGNTVCSNTSADAGRMNLWALFDDGGNAICDCFGDVDGNGISDTADISLSLLFFGGETDPEFIQPDQDMNGTVDTGDVSVLLLNFGPCE